jgi:type III restriction enzyme
MKIALKEFQVARVEELAAELESARAEAARGRLQAVTLASPTGSGKTVIATAVIERLLEGDEDHAPDPDAVVLWLTDQPELNEQTRQKMLTTSSLLIPSRLIVIDAALDQESLSPGHVYFLNTQKLGRNSSLVRGGDERAFTLWETLTNTIKERQTHFYVVIDEAHRGMQEGRDRDEANTIIQKFILGSNGELPPAPLILGISATLARFDSFIAATQRVRRPIEVPVDEVRDSGLVKDIVNLHHPDESQPADVTMLRAAARSWKDYVERWGAYARAESEAPVRPVMLVQVQDGTGRRLSRTDLGETLKALNDEFGHPPVEWFANAFQEGTPITIDGTPIRYLAPSAIDADPEVRIVFFKTSLNTGWDCPRAEVMMSYRAATDDTVIAQLVGRMVRAPLARRIESDEHLNTVTLFLPHYDRTGLERVIAKLKAGDPNLLPPTSVREARDAVLLTRANGADRVFAKLEHLPSYVIPKKSRDTQVKRLGKLATLLARFDIAEHAPDEARAALVAVLLSSYEKLKNTNKFKAVVKESGVVDVRVVAWRYDASTQTEETIQIEISDENVEDLFTWAGKRFGEGLHIAYWKERADAGASSHLLTKLEAYALAADDKVVAGLEDTARSLVQQWFTKFESQIDRLAEGGRQAFNEVRQLAKEPELAKLSYPQTVEWSGAEPTWPRHLYANEENCFPSKFNNWEAKTLSVELAREDVISWLRNPDRKPWSLCIPYEMDGEIKGCYPDFLIARLVNENIVIDIVDPHLLSFDDAWHRAKGMARYADTHSDQFGRIDLVRVEGDIIDRLNLKNEKIRRRVLGVSTNQHLRDLFDTARESMKEASSE